MSTVHQPVRSYCRQPANRHRLTIHRRRLSPNRLGQPQSLPPNTSGRPSRKKKTKRNISYTNSRLDGVSPQLPHGLVGVQIDAGSTWGQGGRLAQMDTHALGPSPTCPSLGTDRHSGPPAGPGRRSLCPGSTAAVEAPDKRHSALGTGCNARNRLVLCLGARGLFVPCVSQTNFLCIRCVPHPKKMCVPLKQDTHQKKVWCQSNEGLRV